MATTMGKDSSLLMAIGAISDNDGYDLVSEALQDAKENYESDGIIGGRQVDVADEHCVAERPGGSFVVRPRISQMSDLMAIILGAGDDAKWYPHAGGTLSAANVQVSHAAAYFEDYVDLYCDEAVFSSEQNRPLQLEFTGHAKTCQQESSPVVPDYTNIKADAPILHSDSAITGTGAINGLKPFRYLLRMRNEIDPDGFANSKSRQFVEPAGFNAELEIEVSLDTTIAGAMAAAYEASPKTPLEIIATYTQGAKSIAFKFQGVVTSPVPNIDSPGRQKHTLTFAGRALWVAGSYAISKNIVEVVVDDVGAV